MKSNTGFDELPDPKKDNLDQINPPENPLYPASEDIYNQSLQEKDIDPENITRLKTPNEPEMAESEDEPGVGNTVSINDLDIPGSELDDQQEEIGSEDEENNYYSLGGDNHNDLEEVTED